MIGHTPNLFTLILASSAAAFSTNAMALDMREAIDLALNSHPSIQAKWNDANAAQNAVISSAWQLGPSASYQTGKNLLGQTTNTTRFQQPIFSGGKLWYGVRQAQAKRDFADSEIHVAQQVMLSRLSDAYFDLIRAQSKITSSEKNLKEHQRLFALINRRNQAGLSSSNDVTTAEMRLQQAFSEFYSIQSQERVAKAQLEELIGRSLGKNENLSKVPPINLPLNWDDAKALVMSNSPTLKSQQYQLEAAQARSKLERSALLPQVFVRHEKYSGNSPNRLGEQTYIAVEYQFGNGISSAYNWSASVSQEQSARNSIANSEKDVINQFTKDWNQYQLSQSQLSIVEKQYEASTEVMASFLRQYNIGKKSWLDVLNAQREMNQTINSLIDVQTSYGSSSVRVAIATGLLNPANTELINQRNTLKK